MRICDAQTSGDDSTALAALITSCIAQASLDHDEGVPFDDPPRRMIEENLWRAIRYGMTGELIDLSEFPAVRVRSTRAALEELVEWVLPVAEEIGAAPFLAIPSANASQRQIARHEAGATLHEIYADEVLEPARV